ncbi:biotin/lipoyl-binding protein [Caldicellulosiruptor changbaiensis]|uniref:Biotin/lipoyl attachment domain-containing protein n=2 Tax=Caldicellulosiruptor TaxID=44000 RepID=A4XKN2_CALS8|nr:MULTISPECIES: biotin/lipoyl-containing protein [Caldicellulosiruptor]ABP67467.1 biotin/lipoyl attachment domain-containing protein [Caldicellulosiruptor saccharolyticus DSM 8903]AZT90389.1 biotin/lipoyl-binding protein [Caldicellulosiruptor changbaiensis]
MRKFKVRINDQEFLVEVEEITHSQKDSLSFSRPKFQMEKPAEVPKKEHSQENTHNLSSNKNAVHAQLPGTIVKILKNEGEVVSLKDPVLVLEAMKMENEILPTTEGRIKKIYVKEGQKVSKGDLLFEID